MKKIICPNCQKEIDLKSTSCIYCGISKSKIEEMIAENSLKKNGKITDNSDKKKKILIFEGIILILVIAIYCKLFLPQILDYSKTEKLHKRIETCEQDYSGTWDSEKNYCVTEEYGIVQIK